MEPLLTSAGLVTPTCVGELVIGGSGDRSLLDDKLIPEPKLICRQRHPHKYYAIDMPS